jgi:polyhydroxybutyrate depolymerase
MGNIRQGWQRRVSVLLAAGLLVVATATASRAEPDTGVPAECRPNAGLMPRETKVDGVRRTYELHVPQAVLDGPVPLLLAFHGAGGSGRNHSENAQWVRFADERGFILVAPDGLARSWDFDDDTADVDFIAQLIVSFVDSGCVDARRVHAAGHSNGGRFSQRVACDLTDVVASAVVYAAAAPDEGLRGGECGPSRRISVAMFHGDADGTEDIEAGRAARDAWIERNGCVAQPATTEHSDGFTTVWRCPENTAVSWREYAGQQHAWPDEPRATELANAMLDFLERYPLPSDLAPGRGAPNEMQLVRSYYDSFHGVEAPGEVPGPRSGTAGGAAVHEWFAWQLRRLGLKVTTQAFGFERFVVSDASLTVGDLELDVWPLYYSGTTPPEGVSGTIVDVGAGTAADYAAKDVEGNIVVAHSPLALHARVVTQEQAYNNALAGGAAALVMAVDGPGNAYFTPNTPVQAEAGPLPVLFVGWEDGAELGARDGEAATVVLDADVTGSDEALAYNTYAVLPGTGDGLVVVGTPLNGWFEVATERGSGIAVLLELARRLVTDDDPPAHTIVFVGTGGHEIEAGGLARFLACFDPAKIAAYVHMGATVGGHAYEEVGDEIVDLGVQEPVRSLHLSENPLLQAYAHAAFDPHLGSQVLKPGGGRVNNPGEQADAYALGIPMAAISGAGLFFHTRGDVPDMLSQQVLAPMSDAYETLVRSILATSVDDMHATNSVAAASASEGESC